MISPCTIRIRQALSAFMLVLLVLVVSFGARSQVFHHWICGEEVQCVYQHSCTGCEEENEHTPDRKTTKAPDPLQPFCQSGFDLKINPIKIGHASVDITELPALCYNQIRSNHFSASTPPRAPPLLV